MDGHINGHIYKWTDLQMGRHTDGETNGQMNKWTEGKTYGWVDK